MIKVKRSVKCDVCKEPIYGDYGRILSDCSGSDTEWHVCRECRQGLDDRLFKKMGRGCYPEGEEQ